MQEYFLAQLLKMALTQKPHEGERWVGRGVGVGDGNSLPVKGQECLSELILE